MTDEQQPMRTVAIKRFLEAYAPSDLAALYNYGQEVQVNVGQDGGERLDRTFEGRTYMSWTDGVEVWKPIRIPRNAATNPEYEDRPMSFDLSRHAEGIGMTGWNWQYKVSKWLAYDFDAITGHSESHNKKLSEDELKQIEDLLKNIPWVTIRYSTSGKGLHLYIFVDDVPTSNHHEHSALARSVLGQLSALVGFDFGSKVDTCGGNHWVWHRKMRNTNGLVLIKQGGIFTDIPANWRDHIPVVKGDRRRVLPSAIQSKNEEDLFEELTNKDVRIELDKEHRTLLEFLNEVNAQWWWDNDRNMLVTHTFFLAKAHDDLGLRGVFKTLATGADRGSDHNCFCFPLRRGSWAVRRFTPGVAEDPSWFQDGAGWTKCYFNRDPDLDTTARFHGGKERPAGGFHFGDAESAQKAAQALGAEVVLPNTVNSRKAILKQHKDGHRIVMEVERSQDDSNRGMEDWIIDKNKYVRVFNVKFQSPPEPEVADYDDMLRHVVNSDRVDAGWVINSNGWTEEPLANMKLAMGALGHKTADASLILGTAILKNWQIVNVPFGEEYPGGRQWNRNAAQLRFKPSFDKETLEYSTWLKLLNHIGFGLDDAVKQHPWCINNGIMTGGDYLKCWVASMFQKPLEQLPYLFLYSEAQNTGKSTLVEALSLLMTRGAVVSAATALTSDRAFNGELVNAVLCFVEELDLSKKGKSEAYNRIKEWTTGKVIQVHPKNVTPYSIPNSTHWIQIANSSKNCPIFPGDTRIVAIEVQPISLLDMIPKTTLLEVLTKEAPDFLAAILRLDLPPSNDRLNIPVLSTELKEQVAVSNQTLIDQFIQDEMHLVDGNLILFKDFCEAFRNWAILLSPDEEYSSIRIRNELPTYIAYGASHMNNQRHCGNISFTPKNEDAPSMPKVHVKNGKLWRGGAKI